jgi:hypothetical protein
MSGRRVATERMRGVAPVPRLALGREEAAASLGVSVDFFDQHIVSELRVVRRGRRKIVAVAELQRWLDRNAALALEDER